MLHESNVFRPLPPAREGLLDTLQNEHLRSALTLKAIICLESGVDVGETELYLCGSMNDHS
jgi:hypothetical protein